MEVIAITCRPTRSGGKPASVAGARRSVTNVVSSSGQVAIQSRNFLLKGRTALTIVGQVWQLFYGQDFN